MRVFSFLTDKTPPGTNLFVVFQQINGQTIPLGFNDDPTETEHMLNSLKAVNATNDSTFFVLAASFIGHSLQSMHEVAELVEADQLFIPKTHEKTTSE